MTYARYYARAGGNPTLIATVAEERGTIADWIWRTMVDTAVQMANAAGESNDPT